MQRPELHIITTGRQSLDEVSALLSDISIEVRAHIDVLHIREKQRSARELIGWHETLEVLLPKTQIYINDRVDAAYAVQASGVQLAWHSVEVPVARKLLGPSCRIGCSVHNTDECAHAVAQGADFLLYGHIFETNSKPGLQPRGLDGLRAMVSYSTLPVIALGGITPANTHAVMQSGCAGVAVMSAFFFAVKPEQIVIDLRYELDKRR